MGIRSTLRLISGSQSLAPQAANSVRRVRPTAPWSQNTLEQIVAADVFGTEASPVTRAEAMRVPPISNARWLICTPLSRHPLKAYKGDVELETQPGWLQRTAGQVPPQFRMLWTFDDLIFHGYSLWSVRRGAAGQILDAERVPLDGWNFNEAWEIEVDGKVAGLHDVILFTSPQDPLLEAAQVTIRAAGNIEESWAARVRDPIPVMQLKQTEDVDLEDADPEDPDSIDEVQEIINDYIEARRTRTGAITYTPYGFDLVPLGTATPELYIEGRNAVAIDVARFTALPASLLSASPVAASLTYSTQETGRSDFQDYSLVGWAMAIEARLSMDDVVPAGQSVKFDLTWLTSPQTPSTGPTVED